jgi:hypothetical protein
MALAASYVRPDREALPLRTDPGRHRPSTTATTGSKVPARVGRALFAARLKMASQKINPEVVYRLFTTAELDGALQAASLRVDLINRQQTMHPDRGAELVRLNALTDVERAEIMREAIGIISSIRAEYRRRAISNS